MYPDCKRIKATLPENDHTIDAIQHLLPDALTASAHVIVMNYSRVFSIKEIGAMNDRYLQSRPYWTVFQEEYPWQSHRVYHVIYIRLHNIDKPLMKMAEVMNPVDCSQRYLVIRGYHDFDEYGNQHYNLDSFAQTYLGAIPIVHIREYAKFIDDGYCPDQINKHLCAFLPMTNCSLPKHYLECKDYDPSCTPGQLVYSSATPDANIIDSSDLDKNFRRIAVEPFSMVGERVRSHVVFNFDQVSREKQSSGSIGSLYYTSIFLRRNYDFRSRSADLIHKFRSSSVPHFAANKQCIGIHIRRHDRSKEGYDMMKYCKEFVVDGGGEKCHNRTTGEPLAEACVHYFDFACNSAAPFGAITLDAYLKAAELLLENPSDPKIAFIITDDGHWVTSESKRFKDEWEIHVFPAQPRHRSRATVNGVTLFSSIEVLQQCNGLVGHSVSAFTVLLQAIMCVRHGPRNNMRFGECPKFFDFRELAH